jgi:hypothetical protein
MPVAGQDQRDWEFVTAYDLPINRTVQPPQDFEGEAYFGGSRDQLRQRRVRLNERVAQVNEDCSILRARCCRIPIRFV